MTEEKIGKVIRMDDLYASLGFKAPDFVENQYGIRIYLGTKGKEDWCVEIPYKLIIQKLPQYIGKCTKNVIVYFISEEDVLSIAEEFTTIARKMR